LYPVSRPFVIYLFLGMLYESYIHPLTILSTLPSAPAATSDFPSLSAASRLSSPATNRSVSSCGPARSEPVQRFGARPVK
jgi:hypothetical protein